MTFSEQLEHALLHPLKIKELIELRTRRFVAFIIVLMLALGTISFAVPAAATITGFGGFEKLFQKQLNGLEFEDGKLSLEHRFLLKLGDVTVLIETSNPRVDKSELHADGIYLTFGSEYANLCYIVGNEYAVMNDIRLSDLLPNGFNQQSLIDLIPAFYLYLVIAFIVTCIGFFIKYAVLGLLFSITINNANKQLGLNLSYGQVFMICMYGQTLGIVISNCNSALNLLPQFLVSLVCIFISIKRIVKSITVFDRNKQL